MITQVLEALSVAAVPVWTDHSSSQLQDACELFNSRLVDVVVIHCDVSAALIDYEKAPCTVVFVGEPQSKNLVLRCLQQISASAAPGVLVSATILRVTSTYSDVVEERSNRMFAEQLCYHSAIASQFSGRAIRLLIAYEFMKQLFGQPFNRFPWHASPPRSVREFHSAHFERAALFCSRFAKWLLALPPAELDSSLEDMVMPACVRWSRPAVASNPFPGLGDPPTTITRDVIKEHAFYIHRSAPLR